MATAVHRRSERASEPASGASSYVAAVRARKELGDRSYLAT